jgi:hypothetical protein
VPVIALSALLRQDYHRTDRGQRAVQINASAERMAALIAWMLVVRVGNLVKDR